MEKASRVENGKPDNLQCSATWFGSDSDVYNERPSSFTAGQQRERNVATYSGDLQVGLCKKNRAG